MKDIYTAPQNEAKDFDIYYEMLKSGIAPMLDALLALCPDEPLCPPEGYRIFDVPGEGEVLYKPCDWSPMKRNMYKKYPGYQPGHVHRNRMKYFNPPRDGAPLAAFIRARLSHAKALWSEDLDARRTDLQFRSWLALHVNWKTSKRPEWSSLKGWSEALDLIRMSCGLPRVRRKSNKKVI